MRQIGFDETWLEFLEQYVMPLQEAAFMQYASEVGFLFLNAQSTPICLIIRYRQIFSGGWGYRTKMKILV